MAAAADHRAGGERANLVIGVVCDFREPYLSNPVYAELPEPAFGDVAEAVNVT